MDYALHEKSPNWLGASVATLLALGLYLPFLSVNYDLNGLYEAGAVEQGLPGTLFLQNHLLYRPVAYLFYQAALHLGMSGHSLLILQVLTAVFGALGVGFAYLIFLQFGQDKVIAFLASLWLATSWAYWYFSTDVSYISMAACLAAAAITVFLKAESRRAAAAAGILAGLAVLTWQANALLIPVIVTCALLLKPSPSDRFLLSKAVVTVSCGFLLTLLSYAAVGVFFYAQRTPSDLLGWVFRYGSGVGLPMWGQWSLSRVPFALSTAVSSILPVNPRLTMGEFDSSLPANTGYDWNTAYEWSLPALVLLGGFLAVQLLMKGRSSKTALRVLLWALMSYAIYLSFIVWWDPFESKWFLIPNLFLAVLIPVCCGQQPGRWTKSTVLVLTLIIAAANFSSTIWPRHSEEKRPIKLARCLGSKMDSADLFLATDWAWADYLNYFQERQVLSVIGLAGTSSGKEAMLRKVDTAIAETQNADHSVYMVDFAAYTEGHLEWLQEQTGFTTDDLTQWELEPAFVCDGIRFLRVSKIP